jgi:sigma-B regulation protein RsbU (phosphoserine phosphatase)
MAFAVLRSWPDAVVDLLARERLAQPDELPEVVSAAAAPVGVDVSIYAVDQEQRLLRPVPRPGRSVPEPLAIGSTTAGRVFMFLKPISTASGRSDPARLWMPLLDGTERLGVLDVVATDPSVDVEDPEFRAQCDTFVQLVGHLVATKIPYGDLLLRVRRTRRMSEASELVWKLLPPLTFSCHRLVIAAILEPCYEVGGDGFDYAVDGSGMYFAVFDTAGHDLRAGLGTATVLSATRAARRDGDGLAALARAADRALATYAPELCFTTAVLAHLDLDRGLLSYINAGHPQPMLLRHGKVVRRLGGGRRMPLGLGDPQMEIAEETLEPDDRLVLFTDGVTDARDVDGVVFGEHRLVELIERQAAADLPAPEALRRLCHAALDRYDGPPTDDATLLMVEWSDSAVRRVLP